MNADYQSDNFFSIPLRPPQAQTTQRCHSYTGRTIASQRSKTERKAEH